MGFIMVFQMLFAALAIAAVVIAVIAAIVSAVSLIIAAAFLIAAKTSKKDKIKKICYAASAVFATPAAIFAEILVGCALALALDGSALFITAALLAVLLALFIVGLKMPRIRLILRILAGLPWILCTPCLAFSIIMSLELPGFDNFGFVILIALSLIITYGSAFLIYRSHRRNV